MHLVSSQDARRARKEKKVAASSTSSSDAIPEGFVSFINRQDEKRRFVDSSGTSTLPVQYFINQAPAYSLFSTGSFTANGLPSSSRTKSLKSKSKKYQPPPGGRYSDSSNSDEDGDHLQLDRLYTYSKPTLKNYCLAMGLEVKVIDRTSQQNGWINI